MLYTTATAAFFAAIAMMGPLATARTQTPRPVMLAQVATTPTVATTTTTTTTAAPTDAKLEAVIDSLQKTYEGTTTFKGSFEQKFTYTMLRRTQSSTGKVSFEKPGRMRWDYDKPAEKAFIVDGKALWIVQPADKVAFVNACFQQDGLTASVAFLWGEGRLREQFKITWFDGVFGDKTDHHLLLLPKDNNSIFARLILVVDPLTSRVKQSVVVDPAGNVNQFMFKNLVFNSAMPRGTFSYKPTASINAQRLPGSCDAPVAGVK